uniref:Potassium channel domain-containing protein n=1 Tax=Tetranychus urticae TaxID=32264 RepID=T1JX03_TETUR
MVKKPSIFSSLFSVCSVSGYGNIGPRTMEGKMLTILYALLGIPLMILFLSKMGSMLANGLRYFYRSCCSCLPSPSASTLPNSGTLDVLDPVHLSSSSGLLSHHAHHSHHHLHDHYHVHHISLNDIHNNTTGHVALHCNSTSPNTTGTLGIVCKGTPGTTTCYGGSGTCNAITVSGSGGGGGGVALSPTVVSMGNSVGPLGGTLGDSETKICPETEVPEHYTTCGGLLLNRHSHATILRGDTLHHHGDHINATLATCQGDHSDYRYQETNHHHPGSSPCNHLINLTSATNNSNPTSKTNDNQMNNKMCDNNYNSNYYPKTVPITLCCIIIAVYIFAGASVFYLWEGWSYWESVYFCFASISTIGLGQATWVLSDFRNSEKKLILCCLYILFGLSLGAMVFNLYQDHLRRKLSNSKCAKRHSTECPHHLTERELLTATPAPNNPLLGEDDFDV